MSAFLVFAVLLSVAPAQAWPPTFGHELNFTSAAILQEWKRQGSGLIVNNAASEDARDRFAERVLKSCGGCRILPYKNEYGIKSYRVTYADDWYFNITTDPAVVEIQTGPVTAFELKMMKERIDRDIFGCARAVGLEVMKLSPKLGTGHIHVGIRSTIKNDLSLLRDFFVDYSNHPELAMGIFAKDRNNAPALVELTPLQQKEFRAVIDEVDTGQITSVRGFANAIRNRVYTSTPSLFGPSSKFQAFNVDRVGNPEIISGEQTFELRGFTMEMQTSAADLILLDELIQRRIQFLGDRQDRVPLVLKTLRSEKEKVERFSRYVTEAGMDFEPFIKYVPGEKNRSYARSLLPDLRSRMCRDLFGH